MNNPIYTRVTEILKPFNDFSKIPPEVLAKAADRGTRVHKYCEIYAKGLFLSEVDEDCQNYVENFKRWFDDQVIEVFKTEERINDEQLLITGQIDLIVKLKGYESYCVIDIKTPAKESLSWRLQTAAYAMLARKYLSPHICERYCLRLGKHGKDFEMFPYCDYENDLSLFLKAVDLYRYFNPIEKY